MRRIVTALFNLHPVHFLYLSNYQLKMVLCGRDAAVDAVDDFCGSELNAS